jgi:hypothetical protein
VVRPSRRRERAERAANERAVSIRLACGGSWFASPATGMSSRRMPRMSKSPSGSRARRRAIGPGTGV